MTRWLLAVAVLLGFAATSGSTLCTVPPDAGAVPAAELTPAPETPDLAELEEALLGPPEPEPAFCCFCCDGCDDRYMICSSPCWNQPDPVACEAACAADRAACYARCPYSCP